MGKLFPGEIGAHIQTARQMGLFFGLLAGAEALQEHRMPVWSEAGPTTVFPVTTSAASRSWGEPSGNGADPANPWDPDGPVGGLTVEGVRAGPASVNA